MAFWNRSRKTKVTGFAEQDNDGQWISYFNQYINSLNNDKLIRFSNDIAYELACNVAEVFFPIDAIAERVSSVNYELVYESTGEPYNASVNLDKLIKQPNPFDTLTDIVYKSVFSILSDGNSYIYTKTPDSIKNPTIDNISNIWVLKPDVTKPKFLKYIVNPFLIKSKNDLIEYYKTFFMVKYNIEPRYVVHSTSLGINEYGVATSPLTRVSRNIDNILAVYQARYNVYSKNGNGGILSRDASSANNSMQEVVDPVSRDTMLKDLMDRNGLTGNKNFIGISSIPLKFIQTLGTIKDLQPFEETEANAIAIAGAFQVDPELVPRNGSSTFTNKETAEKTLWQNVIKPMAEDKAKELTKVYYLPDGVIFKANYDHIEALQEDKKTSYESDSIMIDNLAKLTEAGQNMEQAYNNLNEKYNGNK